MPETTPPKKAKLLQFTAKIVSAHIAKNQIGTESLSGLIQDIYAVLNDLDHSGVDGLEKTSAQAATKRSIFPDYLICLEDGKKLKMLKRHLKSAYNLTPDEYRQKWDLPTDYPMVAPNYMRQRSSLAKSSGLGKTGRKKA